MATTPGSLEHRDDAVPIAGAGFGQIIGLHSDGGVNAVVFAPPISRRRRSCRRRCRSR